jgi:hypothetical protein
MVHHAVVQAILPLTYLANKANAVLCLWEISDSILGVEFDPNVNYIQL